MFQSFYNAPVVSLFQDHHNNLTTDKFDTNPNISLGPTKLIRGTKIRKTIKANKGYSKRRI